MIFGFLYKSPVQVGIIRLSLQVDKNLYQPTKSNTPHMLQDALHLLQWNLIQVQTHAG